MQSTPRIAFVTLRDSFISDKVCYHDQSNARLVEGLKAFYPHLSFVTYRDEIFKDSYNAKLNVDKLYVLPFINTFSNGLLRSFAVYKTLRKIERDHDLIIIQYPFKTPFAPLSLSKPVICHVCSNLLSASANPVKYKGISGHVARWYARMLHQYNCRMFSKCNVKVITNGRELADLYKAYDAMSTVSSSILSSEVISPSAVRKRDDTFRVLFVGRPSLEKGFDTLVEAVRMVPAEYNIRLIFAGFSEDEFQSLQSGSRIDVAKAEFLGYIPFSQQLFEVYKSADVLVLPSRSEGTPRVLIEARAFGCPVVASKVGGIPDSIEDGVDGMLFSPGDGAGLAMILRELIEDEGKRRKLAIAGIERVKSMTLDNFLDIFVRVIDEQLNINER